MQINIHSQTFRVTDEIRERVDRRVRLALDAFRDHVQSIQVQIEDINGPRGGVDKRCHVTVIVRGAGVLMVGVSKANVHAAVNRATRCIKYRISEALRHAQRPETDSIRRIAAA